MQGVPLENLQGAVLKNQAREARAHARTKIPGRKWTILKVCVARYNVLSIVRPPKFGELTVPVSYRRKKKFREGCMVWTPA